jgi:pimeloyl-ACP methyl ester carboxylesterase
MHSIELNTVIQGQGFPILCIHGHPGAAGSMRVFTDHLSQRFRTIAPDLRGYGKTKVRQDFVIQTHLDDLEELLDRHRIDRCLILGWSLGGIIGLEFAVKHPERVSGMILVATAARPWSDHPRISWQDNLYTGIAALLNSVKPGWQWNIDRFAKRSLFRYLLQQHTPAAYQYIAKHAIYAFLNTSPQANRSLNQALQQGYVRVQNFEQIQSPCLMLAAEHDRHINAAASVETAKALPNCDWKVFPQTAHFLPWEIPDQVLSEIDQWLEQHPDIIKQT